MQKKTIWKVPRPESECIYWYLLHLLFGRYWNYQQKDAFSLSLSLSLSLSFFLQTSLLAAKCSDAQNTPFKVKIHAGIEKPPFWRTNWLQKINEGKHRSHSPTWASHTCMERKMMSLEGSSYLRQALEKVQWRTESRGLQEECLLAGKGLLVDHPHRNPSSNKEKENKKRSLTFFWQFQTNKQAKIGQGF